MAKRNIIVIGGSTGSFEVFKKIAGGLPKYLDAAIFIVWHMSPDVRGILPEVIRNAGPLDAVEARDGDLIKMGCIYVARPDHHLLLDGETIRVTRGPKENRFRPAVDTLFRSAAFNFGPRVIGVITSGALDDGTSGLWEVKRHGGLAIVQDPSDAEIASMPENAIREVDVDTILPATDIAKALVRLSQEEVNENEVFMQDNSHEERLKQEICIAAEDTALYQGVYQNGELTPFTCPECSGVLAKIKDGDRVRFRCHTGHAFSADSLLSALTENIEESLWSAIRGVDESIMLLNHLGDHFAEVNNGRLAAKFFQKANEASERNDRVRAVVMDHEVLSADSVERENGQYTDEIPDSGRSLNAP